MKSASVLFFLALVALSSIAGPIPAGFTCTGNCGSLGPDGVVTSSPLGGDYIYVSTESGAGGAGTLPTGSLGGETNGSNLKSPTFAAGAGDKLKFYFNYVTSDGSGFADYGWAALLDSTDAVVAVIFSARTTPSGDTVPGFGMPPLLSSLTPATTPIIGGGPAWSPLGGSSGACYDAGCGYTGWILAEYTIAAAGMYKFAFGTANWSDLNYDTGLAIDGITIGGTTIGEVPEPSTFAFLGIGLLAGAWKLRRR